MKVNPGRIFSITMMSWWQRWSLKSPASRLFTQPFIQTQIKENIKAPRHWPLCGEFTGTGEFPAQMASYAENASIWWRHHACSDFGPCPIFYRYVCNIDNDLGNSRTPPPIVIGLLCFTGYNPTYRLSVRSFKVYAYHLRKIVINELHCNVIHR